MSTDAEILAAIDAAFGAAPRPEHFTNHTHCCECAEHDDVLRSRTRETLQHADVGNPGWDPICFTSAEGFAYYFPALARLALAEPSREHGWYADQLLFHLSSGFKENTYYLHCDADRRAAVARLLGHLIQTRTALIEDYAAADEFLRCHELWGEA
ncbi:hypothetical protein EZ313_05120 [Ramlibacter henchirensis]|uniref:Uncharacterized protein n=1 Tax=Ramlibacter henchirensis TaxID=204072 RepID=A0A4Z0C527_9BURK|nr:hypothetical protein [Ramlibacter henchirensis]TFZ06032.1 hypothetical protein EZ313_05120 [Ramlibacter henchirensis]